MTYKVSEIRRGFYLDSVALMQMSRRVSSLDGVEEAALMMATPSNLKIMTDAGLLDGSQTAAGGGDLVIAIAAHNQRAAAAALEQARILLDKPGRDASLDDHWRPHTLEAAARALPAANLALISVPGDYAAGEAGKALDLGMHAMIFSDNVSLEDEVALKTKARERGLLVMGPDCGTAILNGTPLAFANNLPRGNIGIIGASGTGIQEVACLIAHCGGGISHAIGVGGRDLSDAVGGITTMMAIDVLDLNPETSHIVIISKPPGEAVASNILRRLAESTKTFTVCFIGSDSTEVPENVVAVRTLKEAAAAAMKSGSGDSGAVAGFTECNFQIQAPAERSLIRGLYTGGSLCAEAQVVLLDAQEPVSSNVPVQGAAAAGKSAETHLLLDLGSDEFTQGRPHPMIDPAVRDDALVEALNDPRTGVILLDLVLGFGAHVNPAKHLYDFLATQSDSDRPQIVISVTGMEEDPQPRSEQIGILKAAGVLVAPSNADAAGIALDAVSTKR